MPGRALSTFFAFFLLTSAVQSAPQTPADKTQAESQKTPDRESKGEQILALSKAKEQDEKLVEELKSQREKAAEDYERARSEFEAASQPVTNLKQEIEKLRTDGNEAEAATKESQLVPLEEKRTLARERFDLALATKSTLEEKISALENKILSQTEALQRLEDPTAEMPPPSPDSGTPPRSAPASSPAPSKVPTLAGPVEETSSTTSEKPEPEVVSQRELEAQAEANKATGKAEQARAALKNVADSIADLRGLIKSEGASLDTANKRAENARKTQDALEEEIGKLETEGKTAELERARDQMTAARTSLQAAETEAKASSARTEQLQQQLEELLKQQDSLTTDLERAQAAEAKARRLLWWAQSPLHPDNMKRWLIVHGPRIFFILLAMLVARWLVRLFGKVIASRVADDREDELESPQERVWRAKTLVSVFQTSMSVVVLVVGSILLLQEFSVPIAPLLGGAAVIGLAVAFGAQNLIRDVFYGFFILLENQYSINDVVKIAGLSGLVERITLRTTVLRDLEGTLHFVPNGQITTVSNMTHGWSRALFNVGVSYSEDLDRVMGVLIELGRELRKDPKFLRVILDDPEMLGVDAFGDSAITIKFFIKTKPLQQWGVKREFNRRMKQRFDELGITIPFPQRTIHHFGERLSNGGATTQSSESHSSRFGED